MLCTRIEAIERHRFPMFCFVRDALGVAKSRGLVRETRSYLQTNNTVITRTAFYRPSFATRVVYRINIYVEFFAVFSQS